ncbi:hypothetical protein [Methanospirillum hungatei]|uniref:hypothetical protein n=1 Tax=Methanospirillum hungatei TaxID=2203 RepID=UPI0026EC97DD|nr:hypothetical protein [Methanospirillum hungatei]MCA1917255.1 hypothetical protein [Methanospirillum hungatei]
MVLEEEIRFSSEGKAQGCVKIFRDLNISASLKTKVELESRVVYKAPFKALKGIFEEEIARIRDAGEEGFEKLVMAFEEGLQDLIHERDYLEQTFISHKPGDHINTKLFNVFVRDGAVPETEEDMEAFLREATVTQILGLNNLLDIDEEGMILKGTISPDDAVMSLFGDEIPPFREEALQKWEIIRSLEARQTSTYVVTTGPDVIYLEDLRELEEYFKKTDNEEETEKFFANLQVKQVLVAEILGIIQKDGRATKEQLMSEFIHKTLPLEDDTIMIGFHLSPAYIESVLNDMKKLGLLKGKDSKLKLVI